MPPHTRKIPEKTPRLYRIINEVVKDRCIIFESHKVTKYPDHVVTEYITGERKEKLKLILGLKKFSMK